MDGSLKGNRIDRTGLGFDNVVFLLRKKNCVEKEELIKMNKKMTRVIGIVAVLALIAVAFVGAGAAEDSNGTVYFQVSTDGTSYTDGTAYDNANAAFDGLKTAIDTGDYKKVKVTKAITGTDSYAGITIPVNTVFDCSVSPKTIDVPDGSTLVLTNATYGIDSFNPMKIRGDGNVTLAGTVDYDSGNGKVIVNVPATIPADGTLTVNGSFEMNIDDKSLTFGEGSKVTLGATGSMDISKAKKDELNYYSWNDVKSHITDAYAEATVTTKIKSVIFTKNFNSSESGADIDTCVSIVADSEGDQTSSISSDVAMKYKVYIPSKVTLGSSAVTTVYGVQIINPGESTTEKLRVTYKQSAHPNEGKKYVTLNGDPQTDAAKKMLYSVYVGSSTTDMAVNDVVVEQNVNNTEAKNVNVKYSAVDTTGKYQGNYSDTLTFTVGVGEPTVTKIYAKALGDGIGSGGGKYDSLNVHGTGIINKDQVVDIADAFTDNDLTVTLGLYRNTASNVTLYFKTGNTGTESDWTKVGDHTYYNNDEGSPVEKSFAFTVSDDVKSSWVSGSADAENVRVDVQYAHFIKLYTCPDTEIDDMITWTDDDYKKVDYVIVATDALVKYDAPSDVSNDLTMYLVNSSNVTYETLTGTLEDGYVWKPETVGDYDTYLSSSSGAIFADSETGAATVPSDFIRPNVGETTKDVVIIQEMASGVTGELSFESAKFDNALIDSVSNNIYAKGNGLVMSGKTPYTISLYGFDDQYVSITGTPSEDMAYVCTLTVSVNGGDYVSMGSEYTIQPDTESLTIKCTWSEATANDVVVNRLNNVTETELTTLNNLPAGVKLHWNSDDSGYIYIYANNGDKDDYLWKYSEYMMSPIVEYKIGSGEEYTTFEAGNAGYVEVDPTKTTVIRISGW